MLLKHLAGRVFQSNFYNSLEFLTIQLFAKHFEFEFFTLGSDNASVALPMCPHLRSLSWKLTRCPLRDSLLFLLFALR